MFLSFCLSYEELNLARYDLGLFFPVYLFLFPKIQDSPYFVEKSIEGSPYTIFFFYKKTQTPKIQVTKVHVPQSNIIKNNRTKTR